LGQTLTPVVPNLEAGKFLWRVLSEVRSILLEENSLVSGSLQNNMAAAADQPLSENEFFYRSLVDSLPQNVYRVDRAGRILFGNKTYLNTIGMTLEQCLGKTAYDLFPKELADQYTADDNRVIQTAEIFDTVEPHRVPATDETIYVRVLKSPVRNAGGEVEGVQSIFWEVTSRVRMEQELAHERDLLQTLLDNSPDYIFFKDAESRIIRSNEAHAALLGFADPQAAVGKTDFDLFPPEDAQRYYAEEQEIIQSGQPIIDRVGRTPDSEGNLLWLSETKIPLTDESGQTVGLFGISRNVTARKQAEEILAKRATELQVVTEVGTAASAILDRDQLLQEVVDLTKDRFGLYHAHIYLLDEFGEILNLVAGAGEVGRLLVSEGWRIPIDQAQSLVAQVARTEQGVIVNDVRQVPHHLPNPLLPDTRSEMAVPLVVGGLVLGVLDVQSDQVNHFAEEDIQIQTVLAGQVAIALQNAEQYGFAQQASHLLGKRVQELNCLNELGREMEESPPLPELLAWVTARIPRAMQYPELCRTAIEFDGTVYGAAEAIDLPAQMTHGLYIKGEMLGRIYIAYAEKHDFLDEESALLGAVAGRLSGYIENQQLLRETAAALAEVERRTHREQTLREISDKLRAAPNLDRLIAIATEELGQRLAASHAKLELRFQPAGHDRPKQPHHPGISRH
jgi:PAS domain S-box-containing protein